MTERQMKANGHPAFVRTLLYFEQPQRILWQDTFFTMG